MQGLLKNKTAYLATSFVLLLAGLPLTSAGTTALQGTTGGTALLWAGLLSMALGTVLLPVERLLTGSERSAPDDDEE